MRSTDLGGTGDGDRCPWGQSDPTAYGDDGDGPLRGLSGSQLLATYGVNPRTLWLLRTYWDQLTMVAKSSRYFGRPFKGYWGVTQGDPVFPTIFNVVVNAVIWHWVMVATPIGSGTGGLGLTIIDLAAYFYANDGIMASTQTERLHRAFDVLTGLFDRVGLRKKNSKASWHSMPAIPRARQDVGGGLQETDDWEGTNVLGVPEEESGITRAQSWGSSGFSDDNPLESARHWAGGPRGGHPPPPPTLGEAQNYQVSLPKTCLNSSAWYWGTWVGRQVGPTSGFTLYTATWRIKLWSWRRVTKLTPGAPSATCLCPKRPLMAGTL